MGHPRRARCCSAPTRAGSTPTGPSPTPGPPLLFVGNSRGIYRYAVRSALAIGADLTLHGNDWTEFVERDQIASGGVDNREVGALYASAGIVLNDHHLDMRRDSFASNRLFDAAACGARIAQRPHRRPGGDLLGRWCCPSTTSTSSRAW